LPLCTIAQDGEWDVYMAQYEKGPGSVLLDMSLAQKAPVKSLAFILVTGVKYKDCQEDGFPSKQEFEKLYVVSDSIKAAIARKVKATIAGTFTYQCERLDYYYIPDTAGMRGHLAALYNRAFPGYEPYINMKADSKWEAYFDFLYPNEEIYEYMGNQKVVMGLQNAGDKLEKERKVDHWLYFPTAKDRDCFITYAVANKFKIESKIINKKSDLKFSLEISRTDKVDLESINPISWELRKQAKNCHGDYDGWETVVVK
jgi:hypothetical protein